MHTRELIALLRASGFQERQGTNHRLMVKGSLKIPIGRHKEIPNEMAKVILKEAGLLPTSKRNLRVLKGGK